jgi:hypothetical protein
MPVKRTDAPCSVIDEPTIMGMAVLIDKPVWPAHGRLWGHLVSDSSLAELHAFARVAGIPERSFDHDHYDYPDERYEALIALGAEPVTGRELVRRLAASGLRVSQRAKVSQREIGMP